MLRVGGLFGSSWIGLVKGRVWWKVLRSKRVNMWKKRESSCVCSMLRKWRVQSDGQIGEVSKSINLTLHVDHFLHQIGNVYIIRDWILSFRSLGFISQDSDKSQTILILIS